MLLNSVGSSYQRATDFNTVITLEEAPVNTCKGAFTHRGTGKKHVEEQDTEARMVGALKQVEAGLRGRRCGARSRRIEAYEPEHCYLREK